MEDDKELEKAAAVDRIVNYETYLSSMNNDQLMEIVGRLEDEEEAASALTELSLRDKGAVEPLCARILEGSMGDEFLQAVAFHLLYEGDREQAMAFVERNNAHAPAALLGAMMDDLSADSLQPFGELLGSELLRSLIVRYSQLSDADQERIAENVEWFQESFKDKL